MTEKQQVPKVQKIDKNTSKPLTEKERLERDLKNLQASLETTKSQFSAIQGAINYITNTLKDLEKENK